MYRSTATCCARTCSPAARCWRISRRSLDFFDAVLPIDAEMYRNKKQKTTPESAKEALSALLPVLEAQTDWSRDAIF